METLALNADLDLVYAGRVRYEPSRGGLDVAFLNHLPPADYCFVLLYEGGPGIYRRKTDQSEAVLRRGEGVVYRRGAPYDVRPATSDYRLFGLTLRARHPGALEAYVSGGLRAAGSDEAWETAQALPKLNERAALWLKPRLEEIAWEWRQRQYGWEQALRHQVALLALEFQRRACGVERAPDSAPVRRALAYFAESISQDIALDDAAVAAGLSAKRLIAVFREAGLDSPMECLRQMRLREAQRLLGARQLRIKEIAAAVGMSPHVLIKHYRRAFQLTPTQQRKL